MRSGSPSASLTIAMSKPIATLPSLINCCCSGVSRAKAAGLSLIRDSGVEQPASTASPAARAKTDRIVFMILRLTLPILERKPPWLVPQMRKNLAPVPPRGIHRRTPHEDPVALGHRRHAHA